MTSTVRVGNYLIRFQIRMIDGSVESDNWLEDARLEASRLYGQMLNIARPITRSTRDRQSRRSRSPRRNYGSFSRGSREPPICYRCGGGHIVRFCPEPPVRRSYRDVVEPNVMPQVLPPSRSETIPDVPNPLSAISPDNNLTVESNEHNDEDALLE
ncbi:unnamed protein product [Gordionus sp. m RMFG-2023]